jgi:HAD superfamily phosphatase (TIGR01668 family)
MLYPDFYYDSIFSIPYDELRRKNIRGLIFDVDNTLAPYHILRPPVKVTALFKRLERMGFTISLLTNNTGKRMRTFNEFLNLPGIYMALKPLPRGVKRAMVAMGTASNETVIIGDQLLSDVWAGKNAKIMTILVKPLSQKDHITVLAKRVIERWILKDYFKEKE